jgi:hypothetical protein
MVFVDGDSGGWRADAAVLTAAIEAGWAGVEVDPVARSAVRGYGWEFDTDEYQGEAYLHEEGTCLYMDAPEVDVMRLAIVFRRLAPADLELVFCDEGYNFDLRLRWEATDAELIELISKA